jgi:MFS family permease
VVAAVTIYSLAGVSGLGGRLLLGVMADRVGAKPVLVGGLMVQALAAGAYLFVGQRHHQPIAPQRPLA